MFNDHIDYVVSSSYSILPPFTNFNAKLRNSLQFLSFALRRMDWRSRSNLASYTQWCELIWLEYLRQRRRKHGTNWLTTIVFVVVHQSINHKLRSMRTFPIAKHRTNCESVATCVAFSRGSVKTRQSEIIWLDLETPHFVVFIFICVKCLLFCGKV